MVDTAQIFIWGKEVGAVRWDEQSQLAHFQYHDTFDDHHWDLSPLKMPLAQKGRIFSFPGLRGGPGEEFPTFKGLPGLLADVLPDRYGHQLMDQYLLQNGRPSGSMNPVEQLCFIGSRGMGALEFLPAYQPAVHTSEILEIDLLAEVAQKILQQRQQLITNLRQEEEYALQEILKIGTSAGGARPKAVIAYHPGTGEVRSGQVDLPSGFEHWMIKLDGVANEQFMESKGWGRVEYAYFLMARDAGVEIYPCRLLESEGRAHFMTQRFDRLPDGKKLHMQTWCGMEHLDFNEMFSYSYEQLFLTMRALRLTYPQAEQMYLRMLFNVLATNRDDHTKNFSFTMDDTGRWRLAPAYDLCFSYHPNNFWVRSQTLSVRGRREHIRTADLLSLGVENGVKDAEDLYHAVVQVIENWPNYAEQAGVPAKISQYISDHLMMIEQ